MLSRACRSCIRLRSSSGVLSSVLRVSLSTKANTPPPPPPSHVSSAQASSSSSPQATPAASSSSSPRVHVASSTPTKTTANTANDLRRIYREQQRQRDQQKELFNWEVTQTKVTAWEPKYEDEKQFYFASKVMEDKPNLDGRTLQRYLGGYGTRYLLSKHTLPSGAELPSLEMTNPRQLRVELQMKGNVLHYWFMNLQTTQRPTTTVKPKLDTKAGKVKAPRVLKLNLSRENTWKYLTLLHSLWPRKDERDYSWRKMPRREHGQYRMELQRVLAEGPSKPLNSATQSFIDHLEYQLSFHFKESQRQNRNLNWLQFMGIPGIKINKKLGGEIKVPQLRAE